MWWEHPKWFVYRTSSNENQPKQSLTLVLVFWKACVTFHGVCLIRVSEEFCPKVFQFSAFLKDIYCGVFLLWSELNRRSLLLPCWLFGFFSHLPAFPARHALPTKCFWLLTHLSFKTCFVFSKSKNIHKGKNRNQCFVRAAEKKVWSLKRPAIHPQQEIRLSPPH